MTNVDDIITFDELIKYWGNERPDRLALCEADRKLTYSELEERTAKVAGMLFAHGLKKGDRIAWIGKNSDLYFTLFYGAARSGIVIVPVGWRLAPAEWQFIVNDTQAKMLFTGLGFEDVGGQLRDNLPHVSHILTSDEANAAIDNAERGEFDTPHHSDPALQLYTSGTTGNPKGAVLTNSNLLSLRGKMKAEGVEYAMMDDGEVLLIAMPCAHIGGTGIGVMGLSNGIPSIVLDEFTPDGVFDAIENYAITRLFLVPAALQFLINHPRCSSVDYSGLKYILYGAAPIPLQLLRECIDMFQAGFIQVYGMTETAGSIIALPPEDHDPNGNARMRAAGKPLPGIEVKIFDDNGNEVPIGDVGEIVTRSANNMPGYWNLDEATKSTIRNDGWLHTGDAGYMDADGYVFIHDRVKDMIISGGENVYPAEVESAIYGHPDVMEVAVIGIPDDKWGETVKAVCAPKAGHEIDPDSIIQWARERIAAFKVPKSVDIVDALPRNATGKVLRKDLRAPYWAGFDRQVN